MAEPKEQVTFVVNIEDNNVEILENGYVDVSFYMGQMIKLGWQVERKENRLYLSKKLGDLPEPVKNTLAAGARKNVFPRTKE